MKERTIDDHVASHAKRRGVWAIKMTGISIVGFPDWILLAPAGRIAFAEDKRPGRKPEALQRYVHRRLRRLGFLVAVLDLPEDVRDFFEEWLG